MDIIVPIMIAVLLYKAKIRFTSYFNDPFSKIQTTSINGFFVIMVFIRHFFQYVDAGKYDHVLWAVNSYSHQLIVVSFMFFSGYAIMLKLSENREYINKMPKKIIFLWLHFVLCLVFFLVLNFVMGKTFSLHNILLSLFGLYSIGNSTWYVVAIICLWIITYVSFKLFKEDRYSIISIAVLMILYSAVFHKIKSALWYNTIIAYLLGILFYKYMKKTEKIIKKGGPSYWVLFIISITVVVAGTFKTNLYLFEIQVVFFVLFLVLACYKIQVGNNVLSFLGTYVFEIYLLQRLPMIALQNQIDSNILYFIVCFAITIILALVFKKVTIQLDKIIKQYFHIKKRLRT